MKTGATQDKVKIVQDAASDLILELLKINNHKNSKEHMIKQTEEYLRVLQKNGSERARKNGLPKIQNLINELQANKYNFANFTQTILSTCGVIKEEFYKHIILQNMEYNLSKIGEEVINLIKAKNTKLTINDSKGNRIIPGLDPTAGDSCCQTHMNAMSIIVSKIKNQQNISEDEKMYLGISRMMSRFAPRHLNEDIEWHGYATDFEKNVDFSKLFSSNIENITNKITKDIIRNNYLETATRTLISKLASSIIINNIETKDEDLLEMISIHKQEIDSGKIILSQKNSFTYFQHICKEYRMPIAIVINQGKTEGVQRHQKDMATLYYQYDNNVKGFIEITKPNNNDYCCVAEFAGEFNLDNVRDHFSKMIQNKYNGDISNFIVDCASNQLNPFPQKNSFYTNVRITDCKQALNIKPISDNNFIIKHTYCGTPSEIQSKQNHAIEMSMNNKSDVNNSFVSKHFGHDAVVTDFKRRRDGVSYNLI